MVRALRFPSVKGAASTPQRFTRLQLLINERGQPYQRYGIDAMMGRQKERTGFRVHAQAFRHTLETIATKLGWNFEHLRAAMGHSDYKVLQRYVQLAVDRDLGSRREWAEFIVISPGLA